MVSIVILIEVIVEDLLKIFIGFFVLFFEKRVGVEFEDKFFLFFFCLV